MKFNHHYFISVIISPTLALVFKPWVSKIVFDVKKPQFLSFSISTFNFGGLVLAAEANLSI